MFLFSINWLQSCGQFMSTYENKIDLTTSDNSVIVIEHNQDVIRNADWVIDMGPEGGSNGGEFIFESTPKQLLGAKHSLASRY